MKSTDKLRKSQAKSKDVPKAYEPQKVEDSLYKKWEDSGLFKPDKKAKGEPFSIAMPPPNATGTLHLGHAVMLAIEDIMARHARMNGRPTLWVPGTDHASIATENKVEKLLLDEKKKTKQELGREAFLKEVESFVKNSQDTIKNQVRKMGASCDWSHERYTLDEGLSRCVSEVFVNMHHDGLIYRGHRIVNWCTRCQSTLADDEVEYKEQYAKFYYLKYGPITIGTARPETKVLDKIIIVHPKDKRYKKWVGKTLDVPWIDGTVKATFVADKAADMDMGTGAMTITPAHSFVDFDLAQKHGFEIKQIIGPDGKL
ncbi:MAG: class I tRNA ligase family protein, partial [Patescibacteria group bacterium]|nr:class I tRNA ligase family protein [Patescibacteria group bacterium]